MRTTLIDRRPAPSPDELFAAVRALDPTARLHGFEPRWWDGTAHVPCLLVFVRGQRRRAVTGSGGVLLLPRSSRRARDELARQARSSTTVTLPPGPFFDYRACGYGDCTGIVPLSAYGDDPACPRCGRR